jgi:hypothetical protein
MNAPATIPTSTGTAPPLSIPGTIRLVKLAASITPAAKPSPVSRNLRESFLMKRTGAAPAALKLAKIMPPSNPINTRSPPAIDEMYSVRTKADYHSKSA